MTDKEKKLLRPKYIVVKLPKIEDDKQYKCIDVLVRRYNGEDVALSQLSSTDPDNVDSPFVLMPRKDPAALHAMILYAQLCQPELGAEIKEWLRKITAAKPEYGTQGMRNRTAILNRQVANI